MDPVTALFGIKTVLDIAGGISANKSSKAAAKALLEIAEFNAGMEERNVELIEKQIALANRVRVFEEREQRFRFRETQGGVIAGFAGGGVDVAQGTPIRVLRQNAREFEYDQAKQDFNLAVNVMQMRDAQEDARLRAEVTRMEGRAGAASQRAQGTASLLRSFGSAVTFAAQEGYFDRTPTSSTSNILALDR
jgi:hypothetical protein